MELSEQFQYGPAFKNKPNSQGTLFRPARKGAGRTPESRQPKGYSPERLHAVGEATGLGGWYEASNAPGVKVMEWTGGTGARWDNTSGAKRIAETIARSTVPLEDLKGVKVTPDSGRIEGKSLGRYYREDPGNVPYEGFGQTHPGYKGPGIHIAPGHEKSSTPIHEVGHHVDSTQTGGWYAQAAALNKSIPSNSEFDRRKAGLRGKAEGFADRYADEHARKPGYKRESQKSRGYGDVARPRDWHADYGLRGDRAESFDKEYSRERYGHPDNLQKLQFDRMDKAAQSMHEGIKRYKNGEEPLFAVGHSKHSGMSYYNNENVSGAPGPMGGWRNNWAFHRNGL